MIVRQANACYTPALCGKCTRWDVLVKCWSDQRRPRADHDRARPEYRYPFIYEYFRIFREHLRDYDLATGVPFGATWRRLRYKRHPSITLRNLTLKKDFKWSMYVYQHFQFTGEYSLINS